VRQYKQQSALVFILKSFIPYSNESLMLAYHPHRFFNQLEKISRYKRQTLERTYNRGIQRGLISKQDKRLTTKGLRAVQPYIAANLERGARLMVAFDIPEDSTNSRRRFREILKAWQFKQEQKSVWSTERDLREVLVEVIKELELEKYVEIHEYFRLFPRSK